MDPRRLLISLCLLGVLGGAYYWSTVEKKNAPAKVDPDAPPKILDIHADQISEVDWKRKDAAEPVVAKWDGSAKQWTLTSPKPYPADQGAVGNVVSALASLTSDRLIEAKPKDIGNYGLATPTEEITVHQKNGKTTNLLLGDDTPVGGGTYLKLANDPRVFSIASFTRGSFDKTLNDMRDRRLLRFEPEKVSRFELVHGAEAIEFGKNGQGDWQILKPKPARADGTKVDDIISRLQGTKLDPAASEDTEKAAAAAFSSGGPVGTAKVTDSSGVQSLEVRKGKDGKFYAKSNMVSEITPVDEALAKSMDTTVDQARNHKLFDFGFESPEKIEIRNEAKNYSFVKSGPDWKSGSQTMDIIGVMGVVDNLRDLAATAFTEGAVSSPGITVFVSSGNGKRKEKLLLSKQGDHYLGQRENEPSGYEIDAKSIDALLRSAADVKPELTKKK